MTVVALACALVRGAAWAETDSVSVRTLPVYDLTLADVYGAEQTLSAYAGRSVILSISSRTTSDDAAAWGPRVRDMLGSRNAEFVRFRVVDLSDVGSLFRGIARRRLRRAWNEGHTLLLDWDGAFASAFGVDAARFQLLVIAPDGRVLGGVEGPPTEERMARLATLVH